LVLFFDDFDFLIKSCENNDEQPNNVIQFLSSYRSISQVEGIDVLSTVFSTVEAIETISHRFNIRGLSPWYNSLMTQNLQWLTQQEIRDFFLAQGVNVNSFQEIFQLTGGHPSLVNIVLLHNNNQQPDPMELYIAVYNCLSSIWETLNESEQEILLYFVLANLEFRINAQEYDRQNYDEFMNSQQAGVILHKLCNKGILRIETNNIVFSSLLLYNWILREKLLSETPESIERIRLVLGGIMTQERREQILNSLRRPEVITTVKGIFEAVKKLLSPN
jgi:hypothetical protein